MWKRAKKLVKIALADMKNDADSPVAKGLQSPVH